MPRCERGRTRHRVPVKSPARRRPTPRRWTVPLRPRAAATRTPTLVLRLSPTPPAAGAPAPRTTVPTLRATVRPIPRAESVSFPPFDETSGARAPFDVSHGYSLDFHYLGPRRRAREYSNSTQRHVESLCEQADQCFVRRTVYWWRCETNAKRLTVDARDLAA